VVAPASEARLPAGVEAKVHAKASGVRFGSRLPRPERLTTRPRVPSRSAPADAVGGRFWAVITTSSLPVFFWSSTVSLMR